MFPIRDTVKKTGFPAVVFVILVVNIAAFLFQSILPESSLERFVYLFGVVPARYTHPQWAAAVGFPDTSFVPFFSSMFMHGGWMHIIGNMWVLWIFGSSVEERLGGLRFAGLYLLTGLAAMFLHTFINSDSTVPVIGASGAVAGVMGAYFLMYPRARVQAVLPIFFYPFFITLPSLVYFGLWFMSQFFNGSVSLLSGASVGGVAWWAHVGGFIAGLSLYLFFPQRRKSPKPASPNPEPRSFKSDNDSEVIRVEVVRIPPRG